jgi:hypothetical protein
MTGYWNKLIQLIIWDITYPRKEKKYLKADIVIYFKILGIKNQIFTLSLSF